MTNLKFITGTADDIEEVCALYDRIHEYLERHTNYPGWKRGIYPDRIHGEQGIKEGTLYMARIGNQIAGSVIINGNQEKGYETVSWKTAAEPEAVAVIHTFMVHPDFQNTGVGRALLEFAEKTAAEKGKKVVRLDVYENNAPAIRLYERLGYEYAGKADLGYGTYGLHWFKLYEKPLRGKA
ncbi:GNAT family N-acetyltransferase [Lachnospiraceae bacterium 54-53]